MKKNRKQKQKNTYMVGTHILNEAYNHYHESH